MEKIIKITECDICNIKKTKSYDDLASNHNWTKFFYKEHWVDGIHRGTLDKNIIVCDKCQYNKSGIRKLFYTYIKPLIKQIKNSRILNAEI